MPNKNDASIGSPTATNSVTWKITNWVDPKAARDQKTASRFAEAKERRKEMDPEFRFNEAAKARAVIDANNASGAPKPPTEAPGEAPGEVTPEAPTPIWQGTEEENAAAAPWFLEAVWWEVPDESDVDLTHWFEDQEEIEKRKREAEKASQIQRKNLDWTTPEPSTETEENPEIKDIASFKASGWWINELEDFVENRFGVSATIDWDTVTADVDGERFQWKTDSAGNPIKTSLWRVDSREFAFAQENGISASLVNGKTVFNPEGIDQALDLYSEFGPNVSLAEKSIDTIKASAAFGYLNRFKWASTDVLLNALRWNELWVSGETWDRLTKLNWGEPTAEMIEAEDAFDSEIQLYGVNESNTIISEWLSETKEETETEVVSRADTITESINKLDQDFQDAIASVYEWVNTSFSDYKASNEKLTWLNNELNDTASRIDELNTSKRNILDEIQAQFPNMDRSSQIDLYNQRADSFDDQLFVLQRDYNSQLSAFNYETTQTQAEYEHNVRISEQKIDFISQIYGIQRGDLIAEKWEAREDQRIADGIEREDDLIDRSEKREDLLTEKTFARQDKLIADQIAQADKDRIQAIKDGNEQAAIDQSYKIKFLEEQHKLNAKYADDIKLLGWNAYLERNVSTGGMDLKSTEWAWRPTSSANTWDIVSEHKSASEWASAWGVPSSKWWTHDQFTWVDYVGNVWDPVTAPFDLHVISVEDQWDVKFWKTVLTEDSNGNRYRFSHLDGFNVAIWDNVKQGQLIWPLWNTWYVLTTRGWWDEAREPTAEEREKWWWAHLDFVSYHPDGTKRLADETIAHLNSLPAGYGKFTPAATQNWSSEWQRIAEVAGIAVEIFGSKVSDWERETIESIAKADPSLSAEDIVLAVKRFNIEDPENKEFWSSLLNTALVNQGLEDINLSGLSRLINQWSHTEAVRKIENSVLSEHNKDGLGNEKIREDKVITAVERAKELRELIEKWVESVGPVDWTLERWVGKFKWEEAQVISTKITTLVAQMRNELLGSAVTPSEWLFLEPNVPDLSDKAENILIKIWNLESEPLREFNNLRRSAWLKPLDQSQLLDDNLRLWIYGFGWEVNQDTNTNSTPAPRSWWKSTKWESLEWEEDF